MLIQILLDASGVSGLDWRTIMFSIISAAALGLFWWVVNLIRTAIKRFEVRIRRYFNKIEAIIYAITGASDAVYTQKFRKLFNEKMLELEKDDE